MGRRSAAKFFWKISYFLTCLSPVSHGLPCLAWSFVTSFPSTPVLLLTLKSKILNYILSYGSFLRRPRSPILLFIILFLVSSSTSQPVVKFYTTFSVLISVSPTLCSQLLHPGRSYQLFYPLTSCPSKHPACFTRSSFVPMYLPYLGYLLSVLPPLSSQFLHPGFAHRLFQPLL